MQEKDIKRKLNQELDEMAPDILNKILAQPRQPIKSEKELFGKDRPLFKEKKKISRFMYAPAITAMAACLLLVIFLMNPSGIKNQNMAFSIIVDVNPSITIEVNDDGYVEKVVAGNKDAKKIVKNINKKLDDDESYNKVLRKVLKQLNKKGYLKKEDKAMLLSVVSEDDNIGIDKINEVKEKTKKFTENKNIKCKPVYQNCIVTDEIEEVAKKNNVSLGKAAFAIKIAKKSKKDVDEICKETVDSLVWHAENNGITVDDMVVEETTTIEETSETSTAETESYSEAETPTGSETESVFETTTGPNGETPAPETTTPGSMIYPPGQVVETTTPSI